jgi:putative PIN family toxin of toxin-antitoxin system
MAKKLRPRVFLDTNVVFSGLYFSQNAPGKILEHFIRGDIRVVISQLVLEEIIQVIKEKLPEALPALNRLLINTSIEIISNPTLADVKHFAKWVHFEDAAILAAAILSEPDYFVTGDTDFLNNPDIAKNTGLRIVTPAQLLKLLE